MPEGMTDTPYDTLRPEVVLAAVQGAGFNEDGRILALNSYENRVYQVGIEDGEPVVAKFYRPGRWSDLQILEEHAFTLELAAHEIPVVPPLMTGDITLHHHAGFGYSICQRRGGHWPELQHKQDLQWMGRFIARIHATGATQSFAHRPVLDAQSFGADSVDFLLKGKWIPSHIEQAYASLAEDLLERIDSAIEQAGELDLIRLHGDCHPGNVLWTDAGPHFVDFDDCRTGPAIQDLWMLLSGSREEMEFQLSCIAEGYSEFREFEARELYLVEALRTLRMLHYSAWIARRWLDPAFPMAFPWFNTDRYWEEQILLLREQAAAMDEAPLRLS